jgi:nitronate monooxygenase
MKRVDDFRLRLGKQELVPIMVGGMGVDISTAELALEAARLGGIGHISDAMVPTVSDRRFNTKYVKNKLKQYKFNVANTEKAVVQFDLGLLVEATALHVGRTMEAKRGDGLVFINCMEKLTMNAPRETLRARLKAALDGGIDGITLAAGLHLGSFGLIEDHPRFRDAKLGIIVSSLRALQLFLKKSARTNRLPDYVVIEGPLAGGHLGFGMDWAQYDLATIVAEIREWMKAEQLDIPLIPAGGIFTGSDAVAFLETWARRGAGGDALHRAKECGLPEDVQAGILQGRRVRYRGKHHFTHRLSHAHAEEQPRHRRRHPPQLRGLRLPARLQRQLPVHRGLQPRSGAASGGEEGQGAGQDLPVHPHAQLRDLDLRPIHLPAEGHHAAQ